MITVTLDKEIYDDLVKHKKAYQNNKVVLETGGSINLAYNIGHERTQIKFIEMSDAIKLIVDKIKELETENVNLKLATKPNYKPKKCWQLW